MYGISCLGSIYSVFNFLLIFFVKCEIHFQNSQNMKHSLNKMK